MTLFHQAYAQSPYPEKPGLDEKTAAATTGIPNNSISHIAVSGDHLWIGTSKGAAVSATGGRSWVSFRGVPEFANPGIFAIALRIDTVWTSTGYSKDVDGSSVQTGSGYTFSTNSGGMWTHRNQTMDPQGDSVEQYGINTVRFVPIIVPEQNVTFDIDLSPGTVWIASWASGIRKSTDAGLTWQRTVLPSKAMNSIAPTDTLINYKIDPRLDNNYLGFAVFAESDKIIWAGTAGGINKSTDGGLSWVKFTTQNQASHILGNWVIAIKAQRWGQTTRIWTTNWPADSPNEQYGVSYSDDGGRIWHNLLHGIKAFDFSFRDSVAYVATTDGLYRTDNGGMSWSRSGSIVDPKNGQVVTSSVFYSVGVSADTVYGGTGDGLVRTIDTPGQPFGTAWEISRASAPLPSAGASYAYPNPFSPRFEVTRFHYAVPAGGAQVTIEVFDFGMNRLRTVIHDATRSGPGEHDEIWDGRDDKGSGVPNGVYFYRISAGGTDAPWGKIMVLQ